MKLSALVAAKKIASGIRQGKSSQPRSPWNPVKLRWKRPGRVIAPCLARAQLPVVRNAWYPHFHLHFNLIGKADDQRQHFQMKSLRATSIVGRQDRELLVIRPVRHVTSLWHQLLHTYKTHFQLYCHSREMREVTSVIGVKTAARRTERRLPPIMDVSTPRIDGLASVGGYGATKAIISMRRSSVLPILQWRVADHRIQQERQIDPFDAAGSRASGRPSAPIKHQRLELVWPTRAKINSVTGTEKVGARAPHSQMATARLDPVSPINSAGVAQFREVPVSPPMILDPALVDRLAEDVIRRVEKHIRIERERRGV